MTSVQTLAELKIAAQFAELKIAARLAEQKLQSHVHGYVLTNNVVPFKDDKNVRTILEFAKGNCADEQEFKHDDPLAVIDQWDSGSVWVEPNSSLAVFTRGLVTVRSSTARSRVTENMLLLSTVLTAASSDSLSDFLRSRSSSRRPLDL